MTRPARIAGLFAGFLFAAVACLGVVRAVVHFREVQSQGKCLDNLKILGLGFQQYHEIFGSFPTGTLPNPSLPPERRLSWVVEGWYAGIGDGQVHLNIDTTRAWDDPVNRRPTGYSGVDGPGSTTERFFYGCPGNPNTLPEGYSRCLEYVGIAGVGVDAPGLPLGHPRAGIFGYDRVTTLADIRDGASETMMVIETARDNGRWTAGGPSSVRGLDPARQPYIGKGRQFGGTHRSGANVLYADGSVHFVADTVHRALLEARATAAGGDVVIDPDDSL